MVKVKFKQAFYGPDPKNPQNSIQFLPEDKLPEGNNGVYEFPDDYPLPTLDIEIVEGESTFKKPADKAPLPVTEIKPSAQTKAAKKKAAAKK